VWGRVGEASSASSTEPFFPFLSLRKDLKIRIILNQLGFLKETTNSITSVMNCIRSCSVYVLILPEGWVIVTEEDTRNLSVLLGVHHTFQKVE